MPVIDRIAEFNEDRGPKKSAFVFNLPANDAFIIGFNAPNGKDSRFKLALRSPKINRLSIIENGNLNFKAIGL